MSAIKLLTVFAENKPGQTARVTRILAEAGINVVWVTIASSGTFGVMKFLVSQHDRAVESLKAKGLMVSAIEVLVVEVENRPGVLNTVAEALASQSINLANSSGFVANNRAILVIELPQLNEARAILEKQGLRLLTQEEMLNL